MNARITLRVTARLALLLALVAGVARAQVGVGPSLVVSAEGTPVLRPERVAAEVVGGTYAGVAGYFVGRGIGTIATSMMSAEQESARDRIVDGVGWVGAAFAIGGTVYAIGDMGSETGSFRSTMGGVAAGAATSLVLSRLVFRGRIPTDRASATRKWWVATLECSLPAIGGTIAFNASRKWQR
ncbi:MAG: hypothetical protein C0497_02350 [Gemmatimonas sp.]|nr:hypothetical protein [Gemmatimonas sp.]